MSQRHARAEVVGPSVEVRIDRAYHSVFTTRPFLADETIIQLEGVVSSEPDRHSIQIGVDLHLWVGSDGHRPRRRLTPTWQFLNHSCAPNACVRGLTLVALTAIPAGTEVTFDYNTTEWDIASPFECRCGHSECVGQVRGYRWLTDAQRLSRADRTAPHLLFGYPVKS